MKYFVLPVVCLFAASVLSGQSYPNPEFSNEVYLYRKDSAKLVRLEKDNSKMENKTKMAGFGGYENGYSLDGERSPVRLNSGSNLSFIFSSGKTKAPTPSHLADSTKLANGADPFMMQGYSSMSGPSASIPF